MTTVFINESTAAPATREIRHKAGSFKHSNKSGIPLDEHGEPIGTPWEEVRDELTRKMSEAYGVDFFKVDRMREAGLLKEKDITNELLLSPEFKYEPYPGFKPVRPQKPVINDPEWEAAMEEVVAAFEDDDDNDFRDEFGNIIFL
jgi:hypothetical protein